MYLNSAVRNGYQLINESRASTENAKSFMHRRVASWSSGRVQWTLMNRSIELSIIRLEETRCNMFSEARLIQWIQEWCRHSDRCSVIERSKFKKNQPKNGQNQKFGLKETLTSVDLCEIFISSQPKQIECLEYRLKFKETFHSGNKTFTAYSNCLHNILKYVSAWTIDECT